VSRQISHETLTGLLARALGRQHVAQFDGGR